MTSFLFGVLGSVLFWVVVFAISIFVGTLVFRYIAPHGYNFLITGQLTHSCRYNAFNYSNKNIDVEDRVIHIVAMSICCYFFWPIILPCVLLWLIVKHILFGGFLNVVKFIDKIVPNIKIVKKETE